MALQQVQQVAPIQRERGSSGRAGGGKWGALGGALAAGAIVASGGAAAPAVLGAAGTGAALGGLGGDMLRPAKEGKSAIERRIEAAGPQMIQSDTSSKLRDSLTALHQAPPAIKQQYAPTLANAYLQSIGKDRAGGGQV